MTDLSGQVACIAAPASARQALSMADTNWFQRVVKENRFVVSGPLVGRITSRWISVLAYPLRDEAGQVSGTIAVGVDLVAFHTEIHGTTLPPQTVLGIVDGKGIVVASSVEPQLWVGKDLGGTALVRAMTTQSREQAILRGPDGVERVYGLTPLPAPIGMCSPAFRRKWCSRACRSWRCVMALRSSPPRRWRLASHCTWPAGSPRPSTPSPKRRGRFPRPDRRPRGGKRRSRSGRGRGKL